LLRQRLLHDREQPGAGRPTGVVRQKHDEFASRCFVDLTARERCTHLQWYDVEGALAD
jgi:hypothetical protein